MAPTTTPTRPPLYINPWDCLVVVESIFSLIFILFLFLLAIFCICYYMAEDSDLDNEREPLLDDEGMEEEEMTETGSESERTVSTVDEEEGKRGRKTGFWGACEARVRNYENIR
jgi:hypothetical protein